MIKTFIITTLFLLQISVANSQSTSTGIDLIITINGEVIVGDIMNVKISSTSETKMQEIINCGYYPGKLSVPESGFESIPDSSEVNLSFDFYGDSLGGRKLSNFRIKLMKRWLKSSYLILHVFDLNDKKYKRIFEPISKDQNYTFSITSPDYSFIRVTKKKIKQ
ncbi:hypothetical protein DYU05_17825 [Mucilaginibacter terrenus]|uniref:Uncharacterized protein n=1 Tax=Mucilaginibacter terrenus TaxID=2482727 RepID=A0A3E2NL03_9SPHI|nr:hypothetical protein DYU05_17825 [Mucilaginibacter terrenus]